MRANDDDNIEDIEDRLRPRYSRVCIRSDDLIGFWGKTKSICVCVCVCVCVYLYIYRFSCFSCMRYYSCRLMYYYYECFHISFVLNEVFEIVFQRHNFSEHTVPNECPHVCPSRKSSHLLLSLSCWLLSMAEAVDDRDTDEMKTPLVSCCENSDNGGGGGDCSKADGGGCCAADTNHAGCSQPEKAVSTKTGCENAACGAACQARRLQQMKKLQELREARRWHRGDFDGLYTTSLKRDEEDGGSTAVPAIVWSCLPGITAFLPFVGHAGLLRSDGALLDFAFSYVFNLDMPAFGKPIRILSLEPFMRASAGAASCDFVRVHDGSDTTSTTTTTGGSDLKDEGRFVSGWDKILSEAVRRYQNERYAFFTHNCHTFTAHCLNKAKIPGPCTSLSLHPCVWGS